MSILFWIIVSTFLVSLVSFAGVLILFLKEKEINSLLLTLVAFSAGALLGSAFFHLIPEAVGTMGSSEESLFSIFLSLISGFVLFFIFEHFAGWHEHKANKSEVKPFSLLILFSDALHNFIDGVIIAASFFVSFPAAVSAVLAVAFHEIPQEIGDFGVLVYGGFKKGKALLLNFFSAVTAVLGGLAGFFLAGKMGDSIVFLLPFAAGSFIYISASDLIPEIKYKGNKKKSLLHFSAFLAGISLMAVLKSF